MSGGRPIVVEADEDIFEINDFTVVTELEGFIVSLESLFQLDNSWLKQNEAEKNEVILKPARFGNYIFCFRISNLCTNRKRNTYHTESLSSCLITTTTNG